MPDVKWVKCILYCDTKNIDVYFSLSSAILPLIHEAKFIRRNMHRKACMHGAQTFLIVYRVAEVFDVIIKQSLVRKRSGYEFQPQIKGNKMEGDGKPH